MKDKRAILVVSFGTSYQETRERTIDAIEQEIREAFPEFEFRRAYTSPTIRRILKERDGIIIDSVEQALERLAEEGYRYIAVQTTHVICGFEYDRMRAAVDRYRNCFRQVACGSPLLTSDEDYREVAQALEAALADVRRPGTDIVLMGHGTEHAANEAYFKLQQALTQAGLEDFLVGTVEASPTLENMVRRVRERGTGNVVLTPFMVVAGDHACNDMAGDAEDSWKNKFLRDGYQVRCVMKGLGEYASIRKIYAGHAGNAIKAIEQSRFGG